MSAGQKAWQTSLLKNAMKALRRDMKIASDF